jgi:hypothetical protein
MTCPKSFMLCTSCKWMYKALNSRPGSLVSGLGFEPGTSRIKMATLNPDNPSCRILGQLSLRLTYQGLGPLACLVWWLCNDESCTRLIWILDWGSTSLMDCTYKWQHNTEKGLQPAGFEPAMSLLLQSQTTEIENFHSYVYRRKRNWNSWNESRQFLHTLSEFCFLWWIYCAVERHNIWWWGRNSGIWHWNCLQARSQRICKDTRISFAERISLKLDTGESH